MYDEKVYVSTCCLASVKEVEGGYRCKLCRGKTKRVAIYSEKWKKLYKDSPHTILDFDRTDNE